MLSLDLRDYLSLIMYIVRMRLINHSGACPFLYKISSLFNSVAFFTGRSVKHLNQLHRCTNVWTTRCRTVRAAATCLLQLEWRARRCAAVFSVGLS
eukprot:COSAG06_NODE_152_length_21942_cov_4.593234_15_plen_96_part_00